MQEHFYFTTKKLLKKNQKKTKKTKQKTKKTPDAFELVGLFTLNR